MPPPKRGAGSDAVGHGAPQSRTSRDAVSEYEGRRVQIHGLAGRPELNGRLGWVRHSRAGQAIQRFDEQRFNEPVKRFIARPQLAR